MHRELLQLVLTLFGFVFRPKQKESDQQISVQVEGSLTTFTQTGLAAGQEYKVSIVGEIDGRRGAESSAEFTTREFYVFILFFVFLSFVTTDTSESVFLFLSNLTTAENCRSVSFIKIFKNFSSVSSG